jgi:hypothetical protein
MADILDREALLRETHRLAWEVGYAGFRLEHFNDAAAVKEWPDPAARERELRSFWNQRAEGAFPDFRRQFADVSTERLAGYRDGLRTTLEKGPIDHADFYARAADHGRRARFQRRDPDKGLDR